MRVHAYAKLGPAGRRALVLLDDASAQSGIEPPPRLPDRHAFRADGLGGVSHCWRSLRARLSRHGLRSGGSLECGGRDDTPSARQTTDP
jgi:hypothetical protein